MICINAKCYIQVVLNIEKNLVLKYSSWTNILISFHLGHYGHSVSRCIILHTTETPHNWPSNIQLDMYFVLFAGNFWKYTHVKSFSQLFQTTNMKKACLLWRQLAAFHIVTWVRTTRKILLFWELGKDLL